MSIEQRFSFDNEGEMHVETPVVHYECALGKLACNWLNTEVNSFYDHQFDHVEHWDNQTLHRLPAEEHKELIRTLIDHEFRATHSPIPSKEVINWYINQAAIWELEAEGITK